MSDRDRIDEMTVAVRLPPKGTRYPAACDAPIDVVAPDTRDGMHPMGGADWREVADALEAALQKAGGR